MTAGGESSPIAVREMKSAVDCVVSSFIHRLDPVYFAATDPSFSPDSAAVRVGPLLLLQSAVTACLTVFVSVVDSQVFDILFIYLFLFRLYFTSVIPYLSTQLQLVYYNHVVPALEESAREEYLPYPRYIVVEPGRLRFLVQTLKEGLSMPLPRLPAWVASQVGLGIANTLIVGYRSYERMHYILTVKVRKATEAAFAPLRSSRARGPGGELDVIDVAAASAMTGPRVRIQADGDRHGGTTTATSSSAADTSMNESRRTSATTVSVTEMSSVNQALITVPNRPSRREIVTQVNALLQSPGVAVYFLKPEPKTDRRIIHVYNNQGEKVYAFLRPAARSQTWTLVYADAEQGTRDLATIYAGKKDGVGAGSGIIAARARPGKYVLFNNANGGLTYRKVSQQWTPEEGTLRTFYLAGTSPYHWTKAGFLHRAVIRDSEFFLTDPEVGSPAEIHSGRTAMGTAWGGIARSPPAYTPSRDALARLGRSRESNVHGGAARANEVLDTVHRAWAQSGGSARETAAVDSEHAGERRAKVEHETIAHACKIARGMVWRVAIDTAKINPEVALATAWISVLHQWGSGVQIGGVKLPEGV
ncbi:hypothetical protein BZA70DRAFT_304821 [Myxozyma melibiosi]|uniref:Uncharacterized protein n=1 Tax=Myxozyma melibiosi TaxID=54550 RepID=A0ABR1F5M1_9ASCO